MPRTRWHRPRGRERTDRGAPVRGRWVRRARSFVTRLGSVTGYTIPRVAMRRPKTIALAPVTFRPAAANSLLSVSVGDPSFGGIDHGSSLFRWLRPLDSGGVGNGHAEPTRAGAGHGYERGAAGRQGQHGQDGEEQAGEVLRHQCRG